MGWRCPLCNDLNNDNYHWCPACGPHIKKPLAKNAVATDKLCLDCNKPILSEQAYVVGTVGPRHIGHMHD